MLYLAMDNSLQDCLLMPSGDVSDTQLVQEYKKMSKKPSPNLQNVSVVFDVFYTGGEFFCGACGRIE